jgi:hypothetical protein
MEGRVSYVGIAVATSVFHNVLSLHAFFRSRDGRRPKRNVVIDELRFLVKGGGEPVVQCIDFRSVAYEAFNREVVAIIGRRLGRHKEPPLRLPLPIEQPGSLEVSRCHVNAMGGRKVGIGGGVRVILAV